MMRAIQRMMLLGNLFPMIQGFVFRASNPTTALVSQRRLVPHDATLISEVFPTNRAEGTPFIVGVVR